MKLVIDIPEYTYVECIQGKDTSNTTIYGAIANGTPLPNTNGKVLMTMFPPSVYFGDNEKHLVMLAKDCDLTCYNNEWWNAEYKAESEDKE